MTEEPLFDTMTELAVATQWGKRPLTEEDIAERRAWKAKTLEERDAALDHISNVLGDAASQVGIWRCLNGDMIGALSELEDDLRSMSDVALALKKYKPEPDQ
jgi:hypothetical protein